MIALFLGLAAGPASAGPDVGAGKPPGQSGDPGPKPSNGGEAKKRSGEGAKPGSAARPGKKAARTPHAAKGSARPNGEQAGKPKANAASHHEDSPAQRPHENEPVDAGIGAEPVPRIPAATTTTSLRNPDRDIRALSSGAAGISTTFASAGAGTAGSAGSAAPATEPTDVPPTPPDTVVGGALNPPLLGAGPAPSRWAPFVPALDEPAFPAILLAALAVFLALFGRGDRRDPKLVEAVVDDRTEDVDFS